MKRLLSSTFATAILFALAAGLIGFGGIRAVQAAPRIESNAFGAQVQLSDISTTLVENGSDVADGGKLLQGLVPEGEQFQIARAYDEALAVRNDGTIDEYVRVTVYKYWVDKSGEHIKDTSLKPEYIELNFVEGNGWTIDEAASTPERTVLYYAEPIVPGDTTAPFTDQLSIAMQTITALTTIDGKSISQYEGVTFAIDVVADAVQTHNGDQAMTSAWGRTN